MKITPNCHVGRQIPSGKCAGAFTIIELLAVVAVIAILTGLIGPALGSASRKAAATRCLGNLRQFAVAWTLYAGDNADRLAPNGGGLRGAPALGALGTNNWVNNFMTWETDADNTNAAFVDQALLTKYLGRSSAIYRCPSDGVVSEPQREAGWHERVRSYSMNAMVGDAGQAMKSGFNVNNPYYRQFVRLADITKPATVYVFLDEHPDSIDDGYFVNNLEELRWIDLPASYHDGAASLSYADGHAQAHRWRFPGTRPPPVAESLVFPIPIPAAEAADYRWLAYRTSVYW